MSEKRTYTHMEVYREEMQLMRENGHTYREIAEHFGFKDKYVVKQFFTREQRKRRKMEAGITPRRRGRPPKGQQVSEAEKDYEIKRLRMENQLLRDFLKLAGRR